MKVGALRELVPEWLRKPWRGVGGMRKLKDVEDCHLRKRSAFISQRFALLGTLGGLLEALNGV
jgi:hypothetical protein